MRTHFKAVGSVVLFVVTALVAFDAFSEYLGRSMVVTRLRSICDGAAEALPSESCDHLARAIRARDRFASIALVLVLRTFVDAGKLVGRRALKAAAPQDRDRV